MHMALPSLPTPDSSDFATSNFDAHTMSLPLPMPLPLPAGALGTGSAASTSSNVGYPSNADADALASGFAAGLHGGAGGSDDVADTIVRARKSWKTVKGRSEPVWPPHLEKALVQGEYPLLTLYSQFLPTPLCSAISVCILPPVHLHLDCLISWTVLHQPQSLIRHIDVWTVFSVWPSMVGAAGALCRRRGRGEHRGARLCVFLMFGEPGSCLLTLSFFSFGDFVLALRLGGAYIRTSTHRRRARTASCSTSTCCSPIRPTSMPTHIYSTRSYTHAPTPCDSINSPSPIQA